MKLFVDTAHVPDVEALVPLGIVDGVTTNPSLLAREGGDPDAILRAICGLVRGPVSAEVVSTAADEMVREGRRLALLDERIVVKVPFGREGVAACKRLTGEGIRVNVTLVFSAAQALLAAKVGAAYVSPFVGRLDDVAASGMDLIGQVVDIYDMHEFATEVLVASVRGPLHVVEAATLGADICTCPAKVIDGLFAHPLTDIGLQQFLADWQRAQAAKV
jgi:transaldolase